MSRALIKADFEVFAAEDGVSGLRRARELRPDLIILDIIKPSMDGFEVAQRLHDNPNSARFPILVLTAVGTPYSRQRAVDTGVDDFVTKPFRVEDVVAKARSMTETAAAESGETIAG